MGRPDYRDPIEIEAERAAGCYVPPVGRKDDTGKLRMELLMDMPRAMKGVAEVLHWAVTHKKPVPYVPGSWQQVDEYYRRYMGALKRHQNNIETNGQFAHDAETELLDLKHLACDVMIILELTMRELEAKRDAA